MSNHWMHLFHAANHGTHDKGIGGKVAAVFLIIIGFFFAPVLFGIPIMIYGFYRLFK